ncbi:MAG TPA: fumarylacetoacetate hydrolase family protein [Chitinophagaceae bacterium]|nr:fumarylacetoacetate hydrolase family protein [Chitinophagaceae bacterium]
MKIFCVGRNYVAHVRELKNAVPERPLIFMKPKNALLKPIDHCYYPSFTENLQYECELVIRMNKNGKGIREKFAHRYYDQLSLGIDFTARDLQTKLKKAGHPWEIAKAFDQSAVLGQLLAVDQFDSLANLSFCLQKNGEKVQEGLTANMIFSVDEIIAYISQFFTLNIGDLIYTGTPAGVGSVQIGDKLEGYLEGKRLFDVEIH